MGLYKMPRGATHTWLLAILAGAVAASMVARSALAARSIDLKALVISPPGA